MNTELMESIEKLKGNPIMDEAYYIEMGNLCSIISRLANNAANDLYITERRLKEKEFDLTMKDLDDYRSTFYEIVTIADLIKQRATNDDLMDLMCELRYENVTH